ncbi:hypothetical protein ITG13_06195 [Vibrio cyclitrophicus]|nr:hypothetical protein [Vibrio cyclitrophicus]UPR48774.1 hypothetical protein ITG13_06195 [Vibrio cyclitrophicus]
MKVTLPAGAVARYGNGTTSTSADIRRFPSPGEGNIEVTSGNGRYESGRHQRGASG